MFWIGALVGALTLLFLEAGGLALFIRWLDKNDKIVK